MPQRPLTRQFYRLLAGTRGAPNAGIRVSDVVINEIMYDPISGQSADEFIELRNRGPVAVNLGGWRLSDAVSFTFPSNAVIASGGYVVVAKESARLMTNYAGLNAGNTFGDYSAKLANGERIALSMPDEVVSTNGTVVVTNLIHIAVDEVAFNTGGRWGRWAKGGGSSLELTDAHGDHRLASNWADSDESNKSTWTNIEFTGVLDNGNGAADSLHIFLQGAGECLVDNVEVFRSGGSNLIPNPDFESSLANSTRSAIRSDPNNFVSNCFRSATDSRFRTYASISSSSAISTSSKTESSAKYLSSKRAASRSHWENGSVTSTRSACRWSRPTARACSRSIAARRRSISPAKSSKATSDRGSSTWSAMWKWP